MKLKKILKQIPENWILFHDSGAWKINSEDENQWFYQAPNETLKRFLQRIIKEINPYIIKIRCPNCQTIEEAEIKESIPFNIYIHNCSKCDFTIMESDWEEVEDANN